MCLGSAPGSPPSPSVLPHSTLKLISFSPIPRLVAENHRIVKCSEVGPDCKAPLVAGAQCRGQGHVPLDGGAQGLPSPALGIARVGPASASLAASASVSPLSQ